MAINFPGSLDNFTNPTSASPINSPSHADQHSNANDAIEALEAKVGSNNSVVTTSHDYKIAQLESLVTSSVAGAKSIYQDVRNQSGSAFTKATPVYVSGSEGASGKMLISAASNASEATSSKTMGITTSAISNNSNGQVISEGILEGIDTTGAADGDPVWLGVNGAKIYGLVSKPSAPAHLVFLGIVIRGGQANTGSMYVKIQNGFELQEIHNVELSSLVNGNVLAYDSSTSTWKNTNTLQSTSSTVPLVIKRVTSQTSNLQEWQDQSGGMLAFFNKDGALTFNSSSAIGGTLNVFTSYAGNTGVIIRGFTSQTANLQEWQNSAGTVLATVNASGQVRAPLFGSTSTGKALLYTAASATGEFRIDTNVATNKGLVIRGAGSQTANLQEWQDSAGTVLANIWASGTFATAGRIAVGNGSTGAKLDIMPASTTQVGVTIKANASQTADLQQWQTSAGQTNLSVNFGGALQSYIQMTADNTNSGITSFIAKTAYANVKPMIVQGAASQTANLQEWQNSDGTVLASIYPTGFINTASGIGAGTTSYMNGIDDLTATKMSLRFNSTSYGLQLTNIQAGAVGYIVKGAASQTANLQEWQNSAGTVNAFVTVGGFLGTNSDVRGLTGGIFGGITKLSSAGLTVYTTAAGNPGAIIRGAASQSANLQEWQNSAGTLLASISSAGSAWFKIGARVSGNYGGSQALLVQNDQNIIGLTIKANTTQTANLTEWQDSTGTVLSYITASGALRVNSAFGGTQAAITAGSEATVGLIVRGAASQTANLQEWQNSSGSVLSYISAAGSIFAGSSGTRLSGVNGDLVAIAASATVVPIISKGFASQTANLTQWQDSSGSVLSRVQADGTFVWGSASSALQNSSGRLIINLGSAASVGITVKGFASQTANLQEWQDSSGNVQAKITAYGDIYTLGGRIFRGSQDLGGNVNILISSSTQKGIVVQGAASQTANLQEWQNSAGTVIARVSSGGAFVTSAVGVFGAQSNTPNAQLYVLANSITLPTFVAKATASQTSNLTEWQDSAGTVLVKVAADGRVTFPGANADIHASGNLTVRGSDAWSANASALIGTGYAGGIGLIVKAVDSQTANLQEWQDSSGTVKAYIGANGFINTNNSLRVAGDNISAYRFQGVSDGNYTMNFPGSGNIQLFSATNDTGSGVGVLGIKNATTDPTSNPTTGGILYVSSGALLYRGTSNASQQIIGSDGSVKFTSPAASIVPLIIQHTSSPTSSYFEVRNSAGNPVWGINSTGEALTRTTTKYGANIQNDSNNNNTALTLSAPSTSGSGIALNVYSGSTTRDMARFDNSGVVKLRITSDGSFKGGNSSTISANTATTVDTVALSSFTTIEYTISIKQGSKIRSSKVLVHTDGTSVDSTEYGIMEMGGGITGILVLASVSSTDSILQITIADAATTNATVKLIKTML